MAKTIIRIPRTTAMFVTGLGRILREYLDLTITEHEHWQFDHRVQWEQCSYPGQCGWHGVSDEYMAKIYEEHGPGPWSDYDHSYVMPCTPYEMNVYLASGQASVRSQKVELRARIEQTHHGLIGDTLFIVQIWVCDEAGRILRGEYGLLPDGRPYATNKTVPEQPPRRIAFWRQAEETTPVSV